MDFAVRKYEFRLTHLEQDKKIDKFTDLVIAKLMFYVENLVYEDIRWDITSYESIWNILKEHYKDRIIERYQKEFIED